MLNCQPYSLSFRKGEFFEIFVDRPLGCNFKYASDEQVQVIIEKQPDHEIGPKTVMPLKRYGTCVAESVYFEQIIHPCNSMRPLAFISSNVGTP